MNAIQRTITIGDFEVIGNYYPSEPDTDTTPGCGAVFEAQEVYYKNEDITQMILDLDTEVGRLNLWENIQEYILENKF